MKKIYLILIFLVTLSFPLLFLSAKEHSFSTQKNLKSSTIPNDQYFDKQWYLKKIKAPDSWSIFKKRRDVVIAVIDSGVQIDHPDLKNNIWQNENEIAGNGIDDDDNGYVDDVNGWDFINDLNDPNPKFTIDFIENEITHGTIVAGVAAAEGNNSEGVSGVSKSAKIMPLMVLDSKGVGDVDAVIEAIDYARENGADIINLSFAGDFYSTRLEKAIRRAYKSGILIVSAAGNDKETGAFLDENPLYPVCNDGYSHENLVIGVAATDALDQKAEFSAYGKSCVDISAPGISIFNISFMSPKEKNGEIILNKYYDGYWSGTSMAAPQVSGVIAQIIATNPGLSQEEVVDVLLGSSDYIEKLNPDYKGMLGAGRLNAFRSVYMASEYLKKHSPMLINAPYTKMPAMIKISDKQGEPFFEFQAFNGYEIGVNVSSGDLDNDKNKEIVVSTRSGGGPQVQVYDMKGNLLSQFFAYDEKFRGGVSLAVADVNGDGTNDIITGAGQGGGPHLRVFDKNGNILRQFFAFSENFSGGISVAAADVNGDGKNEIIAGAGPGGGPQVRIFNEYGEVISQFFAFEHDFNGGVNIATANINGGARKKFEIVVSEQSMGKSRIKIFDQDGRLIEKFNSFGKKYNDGVNISSGDIDSDGQDEIICSAVSGGAPHVRLFESNGTLVGAYYAFEESFSAGVTTSFITK